MWEGARVRGANDRKEPASQGGNWKERTLAYQTSQHTPLVMLYTGTPLCPTSNGISLLSQTLSPFSLGQGLSDSTIPWQYDRRSKGWVTVSEEMEM